MRFSSEDQQQKQLNGDLLLVEHCLHNNPKSYSIWLHRRWVMGKLVKPDWERERDLCNLFLKYDERNCKRKSAHTCLCAYIIMCVLA